MKTGTVKIENGLVHVSGFESDEARDFLENRLLGLEVALFEIEEAIRLTKIAIEERRK